MMKDNTVIVLDNSNYKESYTEKVPFKAVVMDKDDITITVKSLSTNKIYELYSNQILEAWGIDEIKELIASSNYGIIKEL